MSYVVKNKAILFLPFYNFATCLFIIVFLITLSVYFIIWHFRNFLSLILSLSAFMKYSIGLEKARFYAYHGVYEAEQILGNWFEVSICVSADIADAGSDVLADTVNYESLYGICAREMRIRSLLIEQVAHRIVVAVARELPAVQSIRLRLAKLNPPLGGVVAQSFVEVEKNFFVDN